MATKKNGTKPEDVNAPTAEADMEAMEGLDAWDDTEGEQLNFKRLMFKPLEAGQGAVLRGYPVGVQPIVSTHDGNQIQGDGLVIATTRPARLTDSEGKTTVHPAGTEALIYCTDELLPLKPYAMAPKCVELGIRVGERIRTNGGRTYQTMAFRLYPNSKTRAEIARISVSPSLRKLGSMVGMDSKGDLPPASPNPVLPQ